MVNIVINLRGKDVVHEYPALTVYLTLFNATIPVGMRQKLEHNDIRWITVSEIAQYELPGGYGISEEASR